MVDTGMEFAGWVMVPGEWVRSRSADIWDHYVALKDMRSENDVLRARVAALGAALADAREKSARVDRLEQMLGFVPPESWVAEGARIIGHRMGPGDVLESVLVDRGRRQGANNDTPVASLNGVVGRVFRAAPNFSQVLLLKDIRSRVPVLGRDNRIPGIVYGQGDGELLQVRFVPLNAPMTEGEVLVTSGWGGVFPKGLPVARVVRIRRSEISLFQDIWAEPLVDSAFLEEVLILTRVESGPEPGGRENLDGPAPAGNTDPAAGA